MILPSPVGLPTFAMQDLLFCRGGSLTLQAILGRKIVLPAAIRFPKISLTTTAENDTLIIRKDTILSPFADPPPASFSDRGGDAQI
jgi:hypothetical protein